MKQKKFKKSEKSIEKTNKVKFKNWKLVVIVLFVVLVTLLVVISLILKQIKKAENERREWLKENCKCIEYKGKRTCFEGYELRGNFCVNGKEFTNSLISCSKYQCENFVEEVG